MEHQTTKPTLQLLEQLPPDVLPLELLELQSCTVPVVAQRATELYQQHLLGEQQLTPQIVYDLWQMV